MATQDANWKIIIKTPSAGGPYTLTFKGNNKIVLKNLMLGEVWVCSGQSNMEFSLKNGIKEIQNELPTCYNKNIRFCRVSKTTSAFPQDNCDANWTVCDSNSLKYFSAVSYYFGKKLNKELDVPIGLIGSYWSGTGAEVWTPENIVNNDTALKSAAAKLDNIEAWTRTPGAAYNGMISPITNYAIAGTIWYQGETNTKTAQTYGKLFSDMIDSWRKKWGYDFPFYYVQIGPFKYPRYNVAALLREAQTQTMHYKNVGMVVISDLVTDTTESIHPQDKHDVGARLANWALAETYHKTGIIYKSPMYAAINIEKNKAVISFDNATSGLQANGKVKELYIAGGDKIFHPAEAKIDKDKLVVWCKNVMQPVAVRYAFGNTSIGNLFSKDGLPVNAFRTDNWEINTDEIK